MLFICLNNNILSIINIYLNILKSISPTSQQNHKVRGIEYYDRRRLLALYFYMYVFYFFFLSSGRLVKVGLLVKVVFSVLFFFLKEQKLRGFFRKKRHFVEAQLLKWH